MSGLGYFLYKNTILYNLKCQSFLNAFAVIGGIISQALFTMSCQWFAIKRYVFCLFNQIHYSESSCLQPS